MDQRERKEQHPSLPPDYVSLAQLQERWLQNQREKEMREKQKEEEDKKERDAGLNENQEQGELLKNNWRVKKASGGPRREGEKVGRERRRAIEEKRKGKETVIGGFDNREENKKNEKKKNENRHRRKQKYGEGSDVEKEKLKSETTKEFDGGDGFEESENVIGNEAKVGIKGVLNGENSGNGGIHGGLKGSAEEIMNRVDFRGGFSRTRGNRGSGYDSRRENRVGLYQLKENKVELDLNKKMEDRKDYNSRNWRERRRNDNDRDGESYYMLKENGGNALKSDVVEMKLEKKIEDENLEDRGEMGRLSGRDRNKSIDNCRVEREALNDVNTPAQDKKVDEEVLAMESVKIGEKVVGNGYRRYGNWSGNNGRRFGGGGLAFNGWKWEVGDHRRDAGPRRFAGRWKTKEREMNGMMWVKKQDKLGADYDDDARVGSSGISEDQE